MKSLTRRGVIGPKPTKTSGLLVVIILAEGTEAAGAKRHDVQLGEEG